MSRRRPCTAALVLALLGAAAATAPDLGSPAAASCAGPSLDAGRGPRAVVTAGAPLVVRGEAFLDGCDDTGACTAGCSGCRRSEVHGLRDVTLAVRQGGRTWRLGSADAGDADGEQRARGDVAWDVVLPPDLRPGRAVLRTDAGGRLVVRVERDPAP